jgi:hypothetical protein
LEAHYANLFAYRVSAQELVLEFGNFFLGQGNRTQAEFVDFDIRVVMSPDLIEQIIMLLEQAKQSRDDQRAAQLAKPTTLQQPMKGKK